MERKLPRSGGLTVIRPKILIDYELLSWRDLKDRVESIGGRYKNKRQAVEFLKLKEE